MTVKIRVPAARSEKVRISGLPKGRTSEQDARMLRAAGGGGIHVTPGAKPGQWLIARSSVHAVARSLAISYGLVRLVYDTNSQDMCTERCQEAPIETADKCQCICLGMKHGDGYASERWKRVGDHLLVGGTTTHRWTYELTDKQARKWSRRLARI